MFRQLFTAALFCAATVLCSTAALADTWSFTDSDDVVHFTNVRPKGSSAGKWKLVLKSDPAGLGKATGPRGDCPRCDKVPSRDRSPERFTRYDDFIYEAASLYQLPISLLRAVIKVESDYDPRVVSVFGARGLMQLMPAVVKDMGVHNVHDPRENILGGTRLLRILANRYDGDLVLTIAAYHAGVGSLAKYGDKVPPYEHTRKYLRMVLDRYYKYVDAERQKH